MIIKKLSYVYFMENIQLILGLNLFISSLFVFVVSNPVHSVLFMILGFFNGAVILFLFGVEFLSLIFIIIYVGAIAILFLFVIMMLDIKLVDFESNNMPYQIFLLIVTSIFLTFLKILINTTFYFNEELIFFTFDSISNINQIGQVIYNYYNLNFLLAGLILLVAMIGPIVLTLNFNVKHVVEVLYKQLSRSDNLIVFFK